MKFSLLTTYINNFIRHLMADYQAEDMQLIIQDDNGSLYEIVFFALTVIGDDSNKTYACIRIVKGNKLSEVNLIENEYSNQSNIN